jgi:transcriptional regulator with XRE-family HTH domain
MFRLMGELLEGRIAAELRAEVRRQNRTGRWLAEQTGLTVSSVARWLRGPRSPGLNELDLMCQALGMAVADLLQRVEVTGGYERTPALTVVRPAGATVAVAPAKSRTSDQKVRGSNPFGCTTQEDLRSRRPARWGAGFVTPRPVHDSLAMAS